MFNVTAIFIHDTLQTTFPLSDAVISEAPWQCAPQHDRLLQLINAADRTSCRGRLVYAWPQMACQSDLNSGSWEYNVMSDSMQAT